MNKSKSNKNLENAATKLTKKLNNQETLNSGAKSGVFETDKPPKKVMTPRNKKV